VLEILGQEEREKERDEDLRGSRRIDKRSIDLGSNWT
jgi:hypothetical protein